jgi:hypothetical protein
MFSSSGWEASKLAMSPQWFWGDYTKRWILLVLVQRYLGSFIVCYAISFAVQGSVSAILSRSFPDHLFKVLVYLAERQNWLDELIRIFLCALSPIYNVENLANNSESLIPELLQLSLTKLSLNWQRPTKVKQCKEFTVQIWITSTLFTKSCCPFATPLKNHRKIFAKLTFY